MRVRERLDLSLLYTVEKDYFPGQKVRVYRNVGERNQKTRHSQIAKVIKPYEHHLFCDCGNYGESFAYDEVERL